MIDRLLSCLFIFAVFVGLGIYSLWIIALEYSRWCGLFS